jgi:septal ring factor EnvC (AmiA/AmiB activator)
LTIRVERLEEQVISYITQKALSQEMLEVAVERFHKQIREKVARLEKECALSQNGIATLQAELKKLEYESRNIAEAIAEFGAYKSPTLLRQLAETEQKSKIVNEKISASRISLPRPI